MIATKIIYANWPNFFFTTKRDSSAQSQRGLDRESFYRWLFYYFSRIETFWSKLRLWKFKLVWSVNSPIVGEKDNSWTCFDANKTTFLGVYWWFVQIADNLLFAVGSLRETRFALRESLSEINRNLLTENLILLDNQLNQRMWRAKWRVKDRWWHCNGS